MINTLHILLYDTSLPWLVLFLTNDVCNLKFEHSAEMTKEVANLLPIRSMAAFAIFVRVLVRAEPT